jgi:acyl-CoA synthetase (AMP-forming)/AMP-acid ligase II
VKPQTIADAITRSPHDRPFVTMWRDREDSPTMTFGEFRRRAEAYARFFVDHGLRASERVLLILPQGIPLMAAFAGALLVGAVPSILAYPHRKMEPMKYRAGLRGASANLGARLVAIDESFPADLRAVVVGDDVVMLPDVDVGAPWRELGLRGPQPDDVAFIQHSAGTTGLQKAVALSHAMVLRQLDHLGERLQLTAGDRVYSTTVLKE